MPDCKASAPGGPPTSSSLIKFQTLMEDAHKTRVALEVQWVVLCAAALCGAEREVYRPFENIECCAPSSEGEDKKKDEMEDDKGWDEDLDDIYLYG